MKRGILLLIIGLIMISIVGCGKPKVNDGPPKKVINSYLEGFRDRKPENIYSTVSAEAYRELRFQGKLEALFNAQESQVGKITGWSYVGKPYIDEVNNQALIHTLVKTTKTTLAFEFDVRKIGDRWYVYGIEQANTTKKNNPK